MERIKKKLSKLTVFDFILITTFSLGIIFFAYIFFRKPVFVTITVKVGEDNIIYPSGGVRDWFSQLFYTGMGERDGLGKLQAEIIEILSYDTAPNKKDVYLKLKLRSVYTKSSSQYSYKGKPVLVGYPIKLQLDNLNVEGLITDIEGTRDPRQKETLLIESKILYESRVFMETNGVREYVADAIKIGDKIYDSKKSAVITVVDKKVENSKKVVTTSAGQVIVSSNPLLKDVSLTLKVEAIKINGKYYLFDDVPILIGQEIPINFPFLSIWPIVTKITPQP